MEDRTLLASDWQNPFNHLDATFDGIVVPLDAIVIINDLNHNGSHSLPPLQGAKPPNYVDTSGDGLLAPLDAILIINALNRDTELPQITVQLANDTGPFGSQNSDLLTKDATLSGTVSDLTGAKEIVVAVDTGVPTVIRLGVDGSFSFDPGFLRDGSAEGDHVVRLTTRDGVGHDSLPLDFHFTFDSDGPRAPDFNLSATSDSGALGDRITRAQRVTLVGTSDPNAEVRLSGSAVSARSSHLGKFQMPGITLDHGGVTTIILSTSDQAGNIAESLSAFQHLTEVIIDDPVLQWNQVTLEAIRLDSTTPPEAARAMAMVHSSIFDVVNAIDSTPGLYVSIPALPGTSTVAAVAAAGHRVLSYLFPGQQAALDAALVDSLSPLPDDAGKTDGIALGEAISDAIIQLRAHDGSDAFVEHIRSSGPGHWQPTAPMFDVPLLPQWGDVQPFAISSAELLLPTRPPDLASQEWAEAFNEVKDLGAADSTVRTPEQTQIARFWADGPGTFTPPGHWNEIAAQIAQQQNNSVSANARLFAQLNMALADAAIVAWNAKYFHDFWRPITAIHQADTDGNSLTIADEGWKPLLVTPPFPEYASGHSTFSGAGAEILNANLGDDVSFTIGSTGLPNVTRTFTNFDAAADEAGRSRVYGGIHYEFSNVDALAAGRAVAQLVLARFSVSTDMQAPVVLIESPSPNIGTGTIGGIVDNENITITGRVLDNLSGVATLQFQLDNGALTDLPFTATGAFKLPLNLPLDGSGDGLHMVRIFAVDQAGNAALPVDVKLTLDTAAPTVVLTSPTSGQTIDVGTLLTGTADATGSAIMQLRYDFDGGNSAPLLFDAVTGTLNQFLDISDLTIGAHTLTVSALDAAGNSSSATIDFTLDELIPFTIQNVTPTPGSVDVGSTFRAQIFFTRAVDTVTLNQFNFHARTASGAIIPANIVPAADGSFAWLFFTNPLPGGSTITIQIDGNTIFAAADAAALDADNDGVAGGTFSYTFSTVSRVPLAGTSLSGKLVDPGVDLKPMTFDDIRAGSDGILHSPDDVFLNPIVGAKVFILGLEDQFVLSDAEGNFHFDAVPAGDIKLAVDGRTATNPPADFYFPEMVMDVQIEVGRNNTAMGGMGMREEREANLDRGEIYLPRLRTSILRTVSEDEVTMVGVDAQSAPNLSLEERALLTLEVQPGSLLDSHGNTVFDGQVGISTVPPELVREMLPPGLLQHNFDITIQAPDAVAFNTPLTITFPNVFNAAPGTQLTFLSFDHTTGMLVIEGTATVSADGLSATTDPGMGITKPGWHGVTPPGGCGGSGGPPPEPPQVAPGEVLTIHDPEVLPFVTGGVGSILLDKLWHSPAGDRILPPLPGCAVPPRAGGPEFTNVTIEFDGPINGFAFPGANSLPLTSQSFTLSQGANQARKLRVVASSYDTMYGFGGFEQLEQDELYGSQIRITEVQQHRDGSRTRDIYSFYAYRWVDVIDAEQAQARIGDTAAFFKTLTNTGVGAPFDRTKPVKLFLPQGVTTRITGVDPSGPFEAQGVIGPGGGYATWRFRPTDAGLHTDQVQITVDPTNLGLDSIEVGEITLKGRGIEPTTIDINLDGFKTELRRVIGKLHNSDGPDGVFGTRDDPLFYIYEVGNDDASNLKRALGSLRFNDWLFGLYPSQKQDPGPDGKLLTTDDLYTPVQEALLAGRIQVEAK